VCSAAGGGSGVKGDNIGVAGSGGSTASSPAPSSLAARAPVAEKARNERRSWAVTRPAELHLVEGCCRKIMTLE